MHNGAYMPINEIYFSINSSEYVRTVEYMNREIPKCNCHNTCVGGRNCFIICENGIILCEGGMALNVSL